MIRLEQKLDEIWQQYDVSCTGVLDATEGREFLKASLKKLTGQEPTAENVDKEFKSIDTNGSGTLERGEVLEFLKVYADQI